MKSRLILPILFALLVSSFQTSSVSALVPSQKTYYVAINHPNAQDRTGNGSLEKPWKSIGYGVKQLQAGDTLLVRGGTYPGVTFSLDHTHSGTSEAPITLAAYPNETVIWQSASQNTL